MRSESTLYLLAMPRLHNDPPRGHVTLCRVMAAISYKVTYLPGKQTAHVPRSPPNGPESHLLLLANARNSSYHLAHGPSAQCPRACKLSLLPPPPSPRLHRLTPSLCLSAAQPRASLAPEAASTRTAAPPFRLAPFTHVDDGDFSTPPPPRPHRSRRFIHAGPAALAPVTLPQPAASSSSSSEHRPYTMASPAQAPIRLAVLECDTPQPQTRAVFNSYTGVFTALLAAAGKQLEPPQDLDSLVSIKGYDVVNELHTYPALDDIDAVLITGSRHTAFDDDPWIKNLVDFTKRALDSGRVRVVGVCFGHQIVGRALGARVAQSSNGWEVAVTEVDLTDKGKELFQLDKMVRPPGPQGVAVGLTRRSESTKCTAISSSSCPPAPSPSLSTPAPSKACTLRAGT